jgi:putative ABC transport system substrate-binding protein
MNKKTALGLLATFLMISVSIAEAQQSTKMPRIGYLTAAAQLGMAPRTDAFRQGLRDLGYVEGKNIVIEWRYAWWQSRPNPRACRRADCTQG